MIDNRGYILFGYHVDEKKLNDLLEEKFEELEEKYNEEPESDTQLSYISDPMRGIDGYFGIILCEEDLDFDQDGPFEIPTDLSRQADAMHKFANEDPDIYNAVLACASCSVPKLLFAVVKS